MARCERCNCFMMFKTPTGYCHNCSVIIEKEEEHRRKEREKEQEEEKRQKAIEEEKKRVEENDRLKAEESWKALVEKERAKRAQERLEEAELFASTEEELYPDRVKVSEAKRNVTRTVYTKLVGCTFNNEGANTESRQAIIADLFRQGKLGFGQELKLVPEPNNRYDSHAVAVFGPDDRQLGHLGKELAYEVFTGIESGKQYAAYVERVNGGFGYSYGISMKIEEYTEIMPQQLSSLQPKYTEKEARLDYEAAKMSYDCHLMPNSIFTRLEKAAKYGLADAQFLYACCFDFGIGTDRDEQMAVMWYEKSAQSGNHHAQCNLAMSYYSGTGIQQSFEKAVYWAEKSVAQGNDNGMVILGQMYESGEGVEQDLEKAFALYLRAAELGNIDGASNAAICFLIGRGVTRNPIEAAKWNKKAAEAGHPTAQFNLANQYFDGDGVPSDDKLGAEWYLRAAENGHPTAVSVLREMGLYN